MTRGTIVLALALTLAPGLALAMGCSHGKSKVQAMTCADGATYDAATATCIPVTSS